MSLVIRRTDAFKLQRYRFLRKKKKKRKKNFAFLAIFACFVAENYGETATELW
jgi:hypothetical protein